MKKYDLVVVGSSFAASFFLKKYLEKAASSVRVLVLERGKLVPHADRLNSSLGKLIETNEILSSASTLVVGNKSHPWVYQIAFGGNSNCWSGGTPRFMPGDFKLKSTYGVGHDWPISYEDLDPYYEEAEMLMNISGPESTPYPRKGNYPQPPHVFTTVDRVLHKTYGNLYINQPSARARLATKGRNACCTSNHCTLCPVNAKFTIENSQLGVYEDARVELVYGAHVLELDVEGQQVKGVLYSKDGKEQRVQGDIVALGANAIFNSHILLRSGDKNKNTGKGIGEQVGVSATVKLKDFENVGGASQVTANGYMLYDGEHRRHSAACLIESNNSPFIRLDRGKYRHVAEFRMIFEDLPEDRNYVSLSDDPTKPKVSFSDISDYAKKGIERMKTEFPKILSVLPVEDISYHSLDTESHIIGTNRMSATAETGVVDKNMIHHTYRNVFVLGSGAFASYSPANPTLTLSALSLLAADKSFS